MKDRGREREKTVYEYLLTLFDVLNDTGKDYIIPLRVPIYVRVLLFTISSSRRKTKGD